MKRLINICVICLLFACCGSQTITSKENPCPRVLNLFLSDSIKNLYRVRAVPPTKDSVVYIRERSNGRIAITDIWKEYFPEFLYDTIKKESVFYQYKHLGVIYLNKGGAGIFSPEKCGCAQKPFPDYKLPEELEGANYEPKIWYFDNIEGKLFLSEKTSKEYPDLKKYFEISPDN